MPSELVEPVLPDYGRAWNGGILPALLGRGEPAMLPRAAREAEAVVVVVLDGLGWHMAREHSDLLPNLTHMDGGPITTVVPSTTSAALTSITTGVPPGAHGILGYRMRVAGEVLNVLRWQTGEHTPNPEQVQSRPPFLGEPVPAVTKREFRSSAFSTAHLRGARFTGYRTLSALVEQCRLHVEQGARVVYAYTDGVDKVAHEYGLRDGFLAAELRATDDLVGHLLDVLPSWATLLVTADHGQVQVGVEGHRSLEPVERLVAQTAGEGRFRTLWARPGATGELLVAAREAFGDAAWVRSRDEAFAEGWFDTPEHPASAEMRGRVGEVILAAREPVIFVDRAMPKEVQMKAHHGSLTADEMLVPLLAAPGRA